MIDIQLYINGGLCDIPADLGVRLNRKLIDPTSLSAKDAQFSYKITLPGTPRNDERFNYSRIEETRNKFTRVYTAELIARGVQIFAGAFRLVEATTDYTGNLYIAGVKTVKDIFGGLYLNKIPEYRIPFSSFAGSVSQYNNAAAIAAQRAIFPYILYGLLPKTPSVRGTDTYTSKTLWDETTRLGIQDLPPAINPLKLIRHLFNSAGYQITGSAFDDEDLVNLYQSYKNASDYVQPWNYGYLAAMSLRGQWASAQNKRTGAAEYERGVNQSSDETGTIYSTDLLDSTNVKLTVLSDPGGNILNNKSADQTDGREWVGGQIRIPAAGLYKVRLRASLHVLDNWADRGTDPVTGVQHIGGRTDNAANKLTDNIYEIKLLRDNKTADFGTQSSKLDGTFFYDNLPQSTTFDEVSIPKYFPQVSANGQINFIDAAQNKNALLGFQFGANLDGGASEKYINPKDNISAYAQIMASKPALSWDTAANGDNPVRLAIQSPGYWKYGRLGSSGPDGDDPNTDVDYSGGDKEIGKTINANGELTGHGSEELAIRVAGYINKTSGLLVNSTRWLCSSLLDVRIFTNIVITLGSEPNGDVSNVCYYDANGAFLVNGNSYFVGVTDRAITPPSGAAYVRFSGLASSTFTITATAASVDTVVLNKFELLRQYNYTFTAPEGSGYVGNLYLFNGATLHSVIPFVNGSAAVDTTFADIPNFQPFVTFYLKNTGFDVNGTLVIHRSINPDVADIIGYGGSNKYSISVTNSPANYAKRGQYLGNPQDSNWYAQGDCSAIVWLEAGELLTIASVSSEGRYRQNGMHSTFGWVKHEIDFNLDITPFRTDLDWLKVNYAGRGVGPMNWNDAPNFDTDSINLAGFLSADVKADEYLDNFCKAFNLALTQTDTSAFSLDLKPTREQSARAGIDLTRTFSLRGKSNTPLGLPSSYKLGFTIDEDEEGFVRTKRDGGGSYDTGATDGDPLEQKSTFSFCWYKGLTKSGVNFVVPIISKNDPWLASSAYKSAMLTRYTDLATRFFYFDGTLNSLGISFSVAGETIALAKVNSVSRRGLDLTYEKGAGSILDKYFTIITDGSSDYTEIEGLLSPEQYAALSYSSEAEFNSDVYYVAEVSAYDPSGNNKTKVKLIKKT